jgi:hypothetical protein
MRGSTVIADLVRILEQKANGTYTPSDGAVLITRDASSGILTFSYPGLDEQDGVRLMDEACKVRGYVREVAHAAD